MRVSDICSAIEGFAPLQAAESWDNSGLIVGSPQDEVHGVMVGFDCTPGLIDEAIAAGCDMVVTHHPLIFKGIRSIDPLDPVGSAIYKAIRGGVAVYASHTSSDKVLGGVSFAMASRLGLEGVSFLDGDEYGLGAVGDLPKPLSGEQAIEYVKKAFGLQCLRCSRPVGSVSRVAVCGGSGGSLIEKARLSGAQLYISGDITYHQFFTREGFMVMDIGHFESEKDIVPILFDVLRKKFPTFVVHMVSSTKNPVFYR